MDKSGIRGLRATQIFKKISCDLRWCDECNVPVIGLDKCDRCGSLTRAVRIVPPGDVRLAFEASIRLIRSAIEKSLGIRAAKKLLPPNSFVLLNKVQSFDVAYEVIVDGYSVGIAWYEPIEKRWLFRPAYYGIKIVVDSGCASFADVHENIAPGKIVKRYDIVGEPLSKYIAVRDRRGVLGLGKIIRKGLAIVKTWSIRGQCPTLGRGFSIERAIEANEGRLKALERVAMERIAKALRLGKAFVTVSGGKDSTVVAFIARECGVKNFVFVDTGLELPETYKTVDKLEAVLGGIERLGDPQAFWKTLEVLGPPARDFRWCSRICKLSHISKWCREKGLTVSITGQRRYESVSRALSAPITRSGSLSRGFVVSPIHEWSSLEVLLYIIANGLPLNPLYKAGFDRVGCFMCPTSRLAEFEFVKNVHYDYWSRWEKELEAWRRRWGLPRLWIDLGLWRWRFRYPGEVKKFVRSNNQELEYIHRLEKMVRQYTLLTVEKIEEGVRILMVSKRYRAELQRLRGACVAAGFQLIKTTSNCIECSDAIAKIKMCRECVEMIVKIKSSRDHEKAIRSCRRALKAWFFSVSMLCLRCGLCSHACGRNAVKLGDIDIEKCSSCARCVFICPISMLADPLIELLREITATLQT